VDADVSLHALFGFAAITAVIIGVAGPRELVHSV
jgi:hypothetical protein